MNYVNINKPRRKRRINLFNKIKYTILALIFFIVLPLIGLCNIIYSENKEVNCNLRKKIYDSMTVKENRIKAYNNAIHLNNGSSSNTCVYFLCEVLRMNGEKISYNICNTTELLDIIKKDDWKIEKNYKKLKPGDICFTTDESLNKDGIPTHVYIFMSWVEEGKYDYAYICDNQAKDYNGKIYHIRNIKSTENKKHSQKEPFSFFIYKN